MKIYAVTYWFDDFYSQPRTEIERTFKSKDDAETFASSLKADLAKIYELRYDNDTDEWIDTNSGETVDFHVDVEEIELA